MKIYTSYFAKLRKFPPELVPISICAKAPQWYQGLEFRQLAPTYEILMRWKKNPNEQEYILEFKKQILSKLNANEIAQNLKMLGNEKDIVLLCYEKPLDFCHRHLVAKWLRENGFDSEELKV